MRQEASFLVIFLLNYSAFICKEQTDTRDFFKTAFGRIFCGQAAKNSGLPGVRS
jgi:hypothetical protein